MRVLFTRSYNLREREIKFVQGVAGIYFIFLGDLKIEYPFKTSRLIYIGMSESKQNSIAMRLRGHLTGQSGNYGIANYSKARSVKFTYCSDEVLRNCGSENIFEHESLFLSGFFEHHGSFPICNGQAGHQVSESSRQIELAVDWTYFS